MFVSEINVRVRYSETDQMGYCYYGNYASYFEVGRVEALRELGISYKSMEDNGIALPVLEYKSKFVKPAYYDEKLRIKTTITKLPEVRIFFTYEVFNEKNELITFGETTLVFIDIETNKPVRAPDYVLKKLESHFELDN